jgi:hypothetical protein
MKRYLKKREWYHSMIKVISKNVNCNEFFLDKKYNKIRTETTIHIHFHTHTRVPKTTHSESNISSNIKHPKIFC